MIELSLVIVIAGLLLAAGSVGFYSVLDARRVAKTQGSLEQVKNCLVEHVFFTDRYPSFTGDPDDSPGSDLTCSGSGSSSRAVDICLCKVKDAWGENLYFLDGRAANTLQPLSQGLVYPAPDEIAGHAATNPDGTDSGVVDKDGNTINMVVFVLISSGRDRTLDHTSYRTPFENAGVIARHAATMDYVGSGAGRPDFSAVSDGDDQVLIFTGPELRTLLAQ